VSQTLTDWKTRLQAAVSPLNLGVTALGNLNYRKPGEDAVRPAKTAAVLVAFLDVEQPELVLTRRADHLPTHPGQVSFPGGAAEPGDRTAVETAIREANEEIGLRPDDVTPLGFLHRMDTISDYRVLPVVAMVQHPGQWRLDEQEVAEVFTVPIEVVMDRNRYSATPMRRAGVEHVLYLMHWEGQQIWGATAAMLMDLIRRMEALDD
jgi:8-oxo-dGTP pyrophosphatase MutT (NUDIX family)